MIYLLGTISVVAALGTALAKQPIRSALSLLTCMLALAGIYALRGAHLIFALQLIIYVGAIMVFLIYIIMLFDLKVLSNLKRFSALGSFTLLAVFLTVFGVIRFVYPSLKQEFSVPSAAHEVTAESLSQLLFSKYLVAFELASIVLLVGLIAITSFFAKGGKKAEKNLEKES